MRQHKTVRVLAKAPDSRGTFEGVIDFNPPEGDSDGERISNWTNLPTRTALGYQHEYNDPGAQVGFATSMVKDDGRHMLVLGRLDIDSNPMAQAVHSRMLLPSADPNVLSELSVGFDFDADKAFTDETGVRVLPDARLQEISVVYRGAQSTTISNVKWQQTSTSNASNATVTWRSTSESEVAAFNRQLDSLLSKTAPPLATEPVDVDAFVQETREMAIAAKLAEVEQARWADDMANRARALASITPDDEGEREREYREREAADLAHRESVREQEVAERDAADEARRNAAREDPNIYAL